VVETIVTLRSPPGAAVGVLAARTVRVPVGAPLSVSSAVVPSWLLMMDVIVGMVLSSVFVDDPTHAVAVGSGVNVDVGHINALKLDVVATAAGGRGVQDKTSGRRHVAGTVVANVADFRVAEQRLNPNAADTA